MFEILIFILFFYLLLISVLGYGFFFQRLCFAESINLDNSESIYIGFYGLFLLSLISYISSLFVSHSYLHNVLLHALGVSLFFLYKVKNKKKYIRLIFLISIFTFSALLISKTHDDFSYYHLPFTKYLTEQKVIFGLGNLLHGYKLLSSLFFLNSTFYLPFIEYYSFHFSLLFFLIFFNFFLYKEIISKDAHEIAKYLYLFALVFFNVSFNRIAEYGTDKVGQLLIVILVIKIFQCVCLNKNKENISEILFVIPLLALCISLKTYFLSYLLLFFIILILNLKIINSLGIIFKSKALIFFIFSLTFYFLQHFISTGCIISPLSFTCFGDNLDWALSSSSYERLSIWLEQWAKAGAGPNFRVDEPEKYIQSFNWVLRWTETYFFGKVSDQLLILISSFIIIFILFKNFKIIKRDNLNHKKIIFFYILILSIFFIWFSKHPTLRYGGYSVVFLTISIPIALIFYQIKSNKLFKKRFKLLIILLILIFNIKNIDRIKNEFQRNDHYKFRNFPFFAILDKKYFIEETPIGLKIYKTKGHCWNTPSPCTQSIGKFGFNVSKKKGYYFFELKNPS